MLGISKKKIMNTSFSVEETNWESNSLKKTHRTSSKASVAMCPFDSRVSTLVITSWLPNWTSLLRAFYFSGRCCLFPTVYEGQITLGSLHLVFLKPCSKIGHQACHVTGQRLALAPFPRMIRSLSATDVRQSLEDTVTFGICKRPL